MREEGTVNPCRPGELLSQGSFGQSVRNLQEYSTLYRNFEKRVLRSIEVTREAVAQVERQEERVGLVAKRVTTAIDSAIEARMERLKQQQEKAMRSEASAQRASRASKNQERKEMEKITRSSKSCSQLPPHICKESEEECESVERESLKVGQFKLLPCRRDVKIQIFACFACFREGLEEWLWDKEGVYLAHMRKKHQVEPDFGLMLSSGSDSPLCSHVFFKGKLTNILRVIKKRNYLQIWYLLKKERYDDLYVTAANYIKSNQFSCDPLFTNAQHFFQHYGNIPNIKRISFLNKISHVFRQIGEYVKIQRNHIFDYEIFEQRVPSLLQGLRGKIQHFLKNESKMMLKMEPLNYLELVSCNPGLQKYKTYIEVPYCEICDQYFASQAMLIKHKHKVKTNHYTNVVSKEYLKEISLKRILIPIKQIKLQLLQEQKNYLQAHLSMISFGMSFQAVYKRFICGQCKKHFGIKFNKEYMHHIYFDHDKIHPTNSHSFIFFSQQQQKSLLENEEGP